MQNSNNNNVNGTVKKITEKQVGNKTYFGLVLQEDADTLYRTGEARAPCIEGDSVVFGVNNTKWGPFVADGTLRTLDKQANSSPNPENKPFNNYQAKEKYWADKELRDIDNTKRYAYRAAHAGARNFIEMALSYGAISLGNKKAADKWDILQEQIDKVAAEYYVKFQNECFEIEAYGINPTSSSEEIASGVPAEEANGADWKE